MKKHNKEELEFIYRQSKLVAIGILLLIGFIISLIVINKI